MHTLIKDHKGWTVIFRDGPNHLDYIHIKTFEYWFQAVRFVNILNGGTGEINLKLEYQGE